MAEQEIAGCFICCAKALSADFLPEKPLVLPSIFPQQPVQHLTSETVMPRCKCSFTRRAECAGLPETSHVPGVSLDLEKITAGQSEKYEYFYFSQGFKRRLVLGSCLQYKLIQGGPDALVV